MKKLQTKYKDDPQRLQQETMKFYRENKVNPFASCLPMVAQLPVFLSLYYMLRTDLRHDICPDVNPPSVAPTDPVRPQPRVELPLRPGPDQPRDGHRARGPVVLYVGLAARVDAADVRRPRTATSG